MALVGVELETLVSEPDALTTQNLPVLLLSFTLAAFRLSQHFLLLVSYKLYEKKICVVYSCDKNL